MQGVVLIIPTRYVKQSISLVPNNASAWNYLRGILEHNGIPYSKVIAFVRPYTLPNDEQAGDLVDLENPPPSRDAYLPCPAAIEFLADIYEAEGGDSMLKATEVCLVVTCAVLSYIDLDLYSYGSPSEMSTM